MQLASPGPQGRQGCQHRHQHVHPWHMCHCLALQRGKRSQGWSSGWGCGLHAQALRGTPSEIGSLERSLWLPHTHLLWAELLPLWLESRAGLLGSVLHGELGSISPRQPRPARRRGHMKDGHHKRESLRAACAATFPGNRRVYIRGPDQLNKIHCVTHLFACNISFGAQRKVFLCVCLLVFL